MRLRRVWDARGGIEGVRVVVVVVVVKGEVHSIGSTTRVCRKEEGFARPASKRIGGGLEDSPRRGEEGVRVE